MKKLAFLMLSASAAIDVSRQAYNSDLVGTIANRGADQPLLHVLAAAPATMALGHWALFFAGFGVLSLVLNGRKRAGGPDIIG